MKDCKPWRFKVEVRIGIFLVRTSMLVCTVTQITSPFPLLEALACRAQSQSATCRIPEDSKPDEQKPLEMSVVP